MRILRQILIILGVWLLGELISRFLHLPLPGNVLGMLIMLVLLQTKVVQLSDIASVAAFFIDNLSFFFIPGAVAMIVYYKQIGNQLIPAIISIILSTVLVFAVTGLSVEWMLKWIKHRKERRDGNP